MEMSSVCSDALPLWSDSTWNHKPELSGSSDSGAGRRRVFQSDEEVLLATSRPKKRAGRRLFKETRHPIFRGVRRRNKDEWVCELREPNKKTLIWLGTYPTPEMAARAHVVAASVFRGKGARLNFAYSAWRVPVPASTSAVDIRKAAAEAAEMFRPEEFEAVQGASDSAQESGKVCDGELSRYDRNAENKKSSDENMVSPEFCLYSILYLKKVYQVV